MKYMWLIFRQRIAIFSQKVFFTFCVEHIAQIIERPSLPHSIFVLPEKIDFQTFNKITTAKLERIHPNKICKKKTPIQNGQNNESQNESIITNDQRTCKSLDVSYSK